MIGILSALPFEAKFLTAENYLVHAAGMGAERAEHGARYLLEKGAKTLISWGVAGGLEPNLRVGGVVIPDRVKDLKSNVFLTDHQLRNQIIQKLKHHFPVRHGTLLQTDQVIASAQDKKKLFHQHQAHAVDMESAAIASVAIEAGIPFIVIRVIIDSAHMTLPHWLPLIFDQENKLRVRKFISKCCRYPNSWGSLFKLFMNSFTANNTMKRAAKLLNFS